MKRKRGRGKRKPKLAALAGAIAKEAVQNVVSLNTQDNWDVDDFDNVESDSRIEIESQNVSNTTRQQSVAQRTKVVDVTIEDSTTSFRESNVAVSANLSKRARSIMSKFSDGFASLSMKQSKNAEQTLDVRVCREIPNLSHKNPDYKEEEFKAALAVIRKLMKMDAVEPFNVPVDPIALGIPDYFDVINTPMDFGTICNNLEKGFKYKNVKDVLRDVQFIWDNCCKYNSKGHPILELMKRVKKNFTKFWKEAGLERDQHHETDEYTMRCSNHGRGNPLGSIAEFRHQHQDQADLCRLQSHQPSLSYNLSYQPQQRPCQCQICSLQQQTSRLQDGGNFCSTVDPVDDNSTHQQMNQTGYNQYHLQQHNLLLGCSQPHQFQHRYCQCHSCSLQPSLLHAGSFFAGSGPSHGTPFKSTMRPSPNCHACIVGYAADNPTHLQQNLGDLTHQRWPSMNGSQSHQPEQVSCQCMPGSMQQQSSQLFSVEDIVNAEGHACAPPDEDPMLRCANRGTKLPVNPVTDYISCQEQDQITPNYRQHHQLSLSDGQPRQTQQVACEGQPSFSLPRPSQPHVAADVGSLDSSSTRKRGRGPTQCLDVWNMKDKISIPINNLGQPIGPKAPKLTNFLGTLARNGNLAPLNYVNWWTLPDEKKEKVWELVQAKFEIDPKSKRWVLKSTGSKWKSWKAFLKARRYSPHETDEERLADLDERVLPDQWQILVSYWNSKEAMERSLKNKTIRAKLKLSHTSGRKSFARVREEEREKRPDGKEPSRADLFILTHTRKDGQPVNQESSRVILQLRERAGHQQGTLQGGTIEDDVFFQVMGEDKHGRVRTYGLGPAPSDLACSKPSRAETLRLVSEASVEVHEMKQKVAALEQTCAQMAAQMAAVMSMMSTIHEKLPDKHPSNMVAPPSEPSRAGLVEDVYAAPEGSQPLKRYVPKRGKKQSTHFGKVARRRR